MLPVMSRRSAFVAAALVGLTATACRKKTISPDDPDERGRLKKIAANLEDAFARATLPGVVEPASLAERLDKWDDFRTCTVRTYVARRREMDKRAREGLDPRPTSHASIGDETVEECATLAAIIDKSPAMCQRLELDYPTAGGELSLAPVRCWDTRARVLGLPDECPVVWSPGDHPARNPECLAMARRDQTLCGFTDSPGRCRAFLTGNPALCDGPDAADNCHLGLAYWKGLMPLPTMPPLWPPDRAGQAPLSIAATLSFPKSTKEAIRVTGPQWATGVSWPAGRARVAFTEDTTKQWGTTLPAEAFQFGWGDGNPAVKIAWSPGGTSVGTRPVGANGGATFIAVWTDPRQFRRCAPGPATTGLVSYDAGTPQPGAVVTGKIQAQHLACTDGSEMNVEADFRVLILDLR